MMTLMSAASARSLACTALLAGLVLAGCQNTSVTNSLPADGYRTTYPIVLADAPETLDIPVGGGSTGLPRSVRDRVRAFSADAAASATSPLMILTPTGSRNAAVAGRLVAEIRREAEAAGLPRALIEARPYRLRAGDVDAPIRLGYFRVKAVTEPCGQWMGSALPDTVRGIEGVEFGCATQANLAAMVSDPTDLIAPRARTSASAARRWAMLEKWRLGESTLSGAEARDVTTGG